MFFKYKKWIRLIIHERYRDFLIVALLPSRMLNNKYLKKNIQKINKLRIKGYKVCIFGAGKHGIEYIENLQNNKKLIDSVLVTDLTGNPTEIYSIPVNEASEYLVFNKSYVFICVGAEYQNEIIENLNKFEDCKYEILTY